MNTQHTPGPWHVNTLETVPHTIHALRGHVADVSRGTMNEVGADEIEANARLIAAAPDLLAAAIEAADTLEGEGIHAHALRAAIAKATRPT